MDVFRRKRVVACKKRRTRQHEVLDIIAPTCLSIPSEVAAREVENSSARRWKGHESGSNSEVSTGEHVQGKRSSTLSSYRTWVGMMLFSNSL